MTSAEATQNSLQFCKVLLEMFDTPEAISYENSNVIKILGRYETFDISELELFS